MKNALIVLSLLFVNYFAGGQKMELTSAQLEALDAIATQDVPEGAPGVATGIVRNGKVIYKKTMGFADLSDSSLIRVDTRFNIASNGKQFTALAILLLEEEGKLQLTDDIRTFFPNLLPTVEHSITIENLLNHSSGIRDVYDLWSLQGLTWWKHNFNNADAMSLLEKQQELNFRPGTQYLYSNSNYILLAEIIARVSGESFVKYTDRMFEKLNMPNTSFEDDYQSIAGPIARPYFNFDTWYTYDWIWNICGDGNIFTTLEDQLEWERTIFQPAKAAIPEKVIKKSQELTSNISVTNYGYGLEFDTYKGLDYQFHKGATGAWKAMVVRFPEKGLSLITMINTGKADPYLQTLRMADVLLDLPSDADSFITQPEKAGDYVSVKDVLGIYLNERNFRFELVESEGGLFLKRLGRNDTKLVREADNIFHQWNDPAFKQEFKRNASGEMEVTAYYTSHAPYTLVRENCDWTAFDFQAVGGRFTNEETGVVIEVQYLSERQYQVKIGEKERTGVLVSPAKLLVGSYYFEINNEDGRRNILLLNGDRVRDVRFIRVP